MLMTNELRNSLVAILVIVLASRWLIRGAGKLFGSYLKRRTASRRHAILKRVRVEEEGVKAFYRRSQKHEDDDWEKIERSGVGCSTNGGQADNDWEGIMGFFHPFWFVKIQKSMECHTLMVRTVTLAAVVRESSGRPSELRRIDGLKPSASCILGITMLLNQLSLSVSR